MSGDLSYWEHLTPCEQAGMHITGTSHTYMDCPTTSDTYMSANDGE